ncbi:MULTISPECIES: hypothetical protein [Moorena]|nr:MULTISPECIES: hypothetical protein [Moorena]
MNSESCFVVSICATRTLLEVRSAVSGQRSALATSLWLITDN